MFSLEALEILPWGSPQVPQTLTDLLLESPAFLFAWVFHIPQIPLSSFPLLSYSHLLHTR